MLRIKNEAHYCDGADLALPGFTAKGGSDGPSFRLLNGAPVASLRRRTLRSGLLSIDPRRRLLRDTASAARLKHLWSTCDFRCVLRVGCQTRIRADNRIGARFAIDETRVILQTVFQRVGRRK
jgi:hypothetical protein